MGTVTRLFFPKPEEEEKIQFLSVCKMMFLPKLAKLRSCCRLAKATLIGRVQVSRPGWNSLGL
jgi:hypothetical protein